MNYTVKTIEPQVLRAEAKDALLILKIIAISLSALPFEPETQRLLDCLAKDVASLDANLGILADKIDELESDLLFAQEEKEEAENEQSRLEDQLDELKSLPESILNHFDRNPHLLEDLRNLEAALRFDHQPANAEMIAQAVTVLESIQITISSTQN